MRVYKPVLITVIYVMLPPIFPPVSSIFPGITLFLDSLGLRIPILLGFHRDTRKALEF
jgi:hypothetical protein